MALVLAATPISGAPTGANGPSLQISQEAVATDLAGIAKAAGWTIEEAEANHAAAEAVGALATTVYDSRPDIFVGSVVADDPNAPPTLYIKGSADSWLLDLASKAGVPILVAEGQPFSADELSARRWQVHQAFLAKGFTDVVTRSNFLERGAIDVQVGNGAQADALDAVVASLPAALTGSVRVSRTASSVVDNEDAFGGMLLRDDGVGLCTSGFSAKRTVFPITTTGIVTAGHCFGVNQIVHSGTVHSMTYVTDHEGFWGDFGYYTTATTEPNRFYSDTNLIRDLTSVEPAAGISINEYICAYGRFSDDADCTLKVLDNAIACGPSDRLVQMNGDTQVGGDSGGPWYLYNRAYGIHAGDCLSKDSFSVADYIGSGMSGVRLLTQ